MKITTSAAGLLSVALLAGCASTAHHHAAQPTSPRPAAPPATRPPASPSASVVASDERAFAYWLAGSPTDTSGVRNVIAGPLMRAYAQFEANFVAADAATGNPDPAESVTGVPGGYQLCGTDSSGNTSCDTFTGFRTDAAGRVTDLEVDGQRIAPRLAVGTSDTGSQLAISHVVCYRIASYPHAVVSFRVRNISGHVVGNGNPAFLALFTPTGGSQQQEDDFTSAMPGNLQPGDSVTAYAVFGTRTVTGQFSLRTNDQIESVLAATTLHRP